MVSLSIQLPKLKSWEFSLISFSSSPLMHHPLASPFSFASKMYSDFCSVSTTIPSSIHPVFDVAKPTVGLISLPFITFLEPSWPLFSL